MEEWLQEWKYLQQKEREYSLKMERVKAKMKRFLEQETEHRCWAKGPWKVQLQTQSRIRWDRDKMPPDILRQYGSVHSFERLWITEKKE